MVLRVFHYVVSGSFSEDVIFYTPEVMGWRFILLLSNKKCVDSKDWLSLLKRTQCTSPCTLRWHHELNRISRWMNGVCCYFKNTLSFASNPPSTTRWGSLRGSPLFPQFHTP